MNPFGHPLEKLHTALVRNRDKVPTELPMPERRECFVGSPAFFHLNHAVLIIKYAFDATPYLVGSSVTNRNWRDIDIRVMLDDDQYDRLFPNAPRNPRLHPLWSLMCATVSDWLTLASGVPVDFQIQRQSVANEMFSGKPRVPLGILC
jgi:hypothetical protein